MLQSKQSTVLTLFVTLCWIIVTAQSENYGPGFFNHTGCLYAYTDGGEFQFTTSEGKEIQLPLELGSIIYDSSKSRCTSKDKAGKLVFSFDLTKAQKDPLISIVTFSMRIFPSPSEGHWEISQANLTITRADVEKRRTFQLKLDDIYAGLDHSYSCNEFMLQTVTKKKPTNETGTYEPRASIVLKRFQVQPFPESKRAVFAPSFDCATWFTTPGIMGLTLLVFMSLVIIVATIVLSKIETNDFKYSKEGVLYTQAQLEANKQQ